MSSLYDAAIIGGGFSGLMVAANLALRDGPDHERPQPALYWCDDHGHRGGTAYATREGHHLLNVRADGMSAWLGGGADFTRWLAAHYPGAYDGHSFVPRMIYAQYMASIRLKMATALGERLTCDHNRAISAVARGDGWHLGMADGTVIRARHIVLAGGNPPCGDKGWPEGSRFIADAWRWRLAGGTAPDAAHIVIVGTGLTAVDMILSLRADGYDGPVTAVSPHGWFPRPHEDPVTSYAHGREMAAEMMQARTARGYLRLLRGHIARARGDWRAVIGGIRDHTVMLWQALPPAEQSRFMRHLWSRWNVHRHRMAADIHARLTGDDRLRVVAGIVAVDAAGTVTVRGRDGQDATIADATVINCTGPDYRRMVAGDPLLASLLAGGYVAAGPLGLGIATPLVPGLHALGTVLLGERLETTAVPDLRQQAAAVATRIAAAL